MNIEPWKYDKVWSSLTDEQKFHLFSVWSTWGWSNLTADKLARVQSGIDATVPRPT
jgi:hypothetical protein